MTPMAWSQRKLSNSRDEVLRPRSHTSLFLRVAFCLLPVALFAALSGCGRQDEVLGSVSIPIPSGMKKIPDKAFVPVPEFAGGGASYQGKVTPGEIFDFYQEVMAARGWQPDPRFVDQKDKLAYTKNNTAVLIWHSLNPDGTTLLTIMVGAKDPPK